MDPPNYGDISLQLFLISEFGFSFVVLIDFFFLKMQVKAANIVQQSVKNRTFAPCDRLKRVPPGDIL